MEQMTQELDINQYDIKGIQKLYNQICQNNIFLNTYTLSDVEESKKRVFFVLMKKYNYKNETYIQTFVDDTATQLINHLFKNVDGSDKNTQMVGVKNVIQDIRKVNPKYFEESFRMINIDSMYRKNLWKTNFEYDNKTSTDMIVDLNDSLDNVISLELTNICIPFTFYNIDSEYGNNYFYIRKISESDEISNSELVKLEIPSGNYTKETIVSVINDRFDTYYGESVIVCSLDTFTNKIEISNRSNDYDFVFVFYDYNDKTESFYDHSKVRTQSKINHNLGWSLGFRSINQENNCLEYSIPKDTHIIAEAICYIPYTKYFIIVIDDMNKGQSNKGLVQISKNKSFIAQTQTFKNTNVDTNCLTEANCAELVANRKNITKNQIYSAMQINNHRNNFNTKDSKMTTELVNNVFAVIPFENKSTIWGITCFTSDKNRFKRKYAGPVNIGRLSIKLLDDKGNVLNLNGSDWSFTMMSTHVYER
jgi:hypothetical protein